ncbi:MAG TPA: adenylate/guanylate cyclase domain-containing protein, partial [Patescibacteria group bacterium]|nr:adenylate/guanylate cyclase domain-containing protein [Patescibacteria group bacterium]
RVAADVLTRETGTASIDLAFHLMAANRWSEAVPIGIKAAGEAERNQAFPEAAQLYERLLSRVTDAPTRAELLCRAGVAHHQASEPAKAQRYLEQGIPWFESNGQELTAAGYRIILGRCFWERAQPDVARAEYERARAVLEKAGPSEALATAYVRLAGLRMFEFEDEECLALANRAVEVAAAANVESARIWAGVFAGGALVNLGRFDEGFARMDLAYTEATARGLTEIAGNALYNGEAMRVRALRAKDALERLPLFEGLRISGRANVLELAAQCFTWQALGEPARAREPAEQALQLAQETQSHTLERVIRRDLGAAIGEQGRPQEGLRVMGAFEPALELQELVPQLRCRMRLLIDSGEVAAAEAHASTVLARPNWGPAFEARALEDTAVEVLIAASRLEDAEHIVSRVRPIDAATAPFDDRMSGRLALAKGDPASARELLVKAATAFENAGYAVEAIRTRRALADAHVAAGDLEAAKAELSAAVESSDIHGAIFNGDLARLRLAGLGVAAAPAPARPADQSQPQERVVTILFADVRGYSRLAASQAPADLVDVIASFHRWAKHEVERHHGMVDKFAGDAVMAIFNAGGARLDHTVQAVQAALAIRDKAGAAGLPVGIGIAVGPAVVGPLTSNANTSAIGEVTNLASRLQAQAAAGELLLSDEAFRRTRDWLQERSMEPSEEELNLKGLAGPVKALRLNAPRLGTPR